MKNKGNSWRGIKILVPPILIFGFITTATAAFGGVEGSWAALAPDPCRRVDCFCEPFHPSFILQPINTFSNLGLILAGLLIGWTGGYGQFPLASTRNNNLMTAQRACPAIYGGTLIAAGVGSLFYHASLSRAGELADLVGIYLFLSFVLFYNLARLSLLRRSSLLAGYTGLNLILGIQMIIAPRLQPLCFGGLVLAAAILEFLVLRIHKPRIDLGRLALALAIFVAGSALWAVTELALPCPLGDSFPIHAAWHVLAACAGVALYGYYLSEKISIPGRFVLK